MQHRPTRRTTLLLGLSLAAAPAAGLAVSRYAPHADAAVQASGLDDPAKKEIAMEIVCSAENSSLDWKAQYKYIEDIDDGRGYTAGIIGFCSGTGDMLELVELYADRKPNNVLQKYLPALRRVNGSDSQSGLDPNYTKDWKTAAKDTAFQQCQNDERDRVYFNPAVSQGKADGLRTLGQFCYYDVIVMHGPGSDSTSFGGIRKRALSKAKPPSQGGSETLSGCSSATATSTSTPRSTGRCTATPTTSASGGTRRRSTQPGLHRTTRDGSPAASCRGSGRG